MERDCPCGIGHQNCESGVWVGDCPPCVPGSVRWCDEPNYCHWGTQVCTDEGVWGDCTETTARPEGCEEGTFYDTACCVAVGECCQDFAGGSDASIGNCEEQCDEA